MSRRKEAFELFEAQDHDGLEKWVRDMNESGLRNEATAILRELAALARQDVVRRR